MKLKITVTYEYAVTVDDNDPVVKDYDSTEELVNHLADYHFSSVLPVLKSGVTVDDTEVISVSFKPTK